MIRSKRTISPPKDQSGRVQQEVRAGRAKSVSGYIGQALEENERGESLQAVVRNLIEQHGEPTASDIQWAERALPPRRG